MRLRRFITGALHLVLDPTLPVVRTMGSITSYSVTPQPFVLSGGLATANASSLKTSVKGVHSVDIVATLETGSGTKQVHWAQAADLANQQHYADEGAYEVRLLISFPPLVEIDLSSPKSQEVEHSTNCIITSVHDAVSIFRDVYSFGLSLTTNYTAISSFHFSVTLPNYTYNRALTLPAALGGLGEARVTRSTQKGWAKIEGKEEGRSKGSASTREKYDYKGEKGETYWEDIRGSSPFPFPLQGCELTI